MSVIWKWIQAKVQSIYWAGKEASLSDTGGEPNGYIMLFVHPINSTSLFALKYYCEFT